ncbi:MAG TPA: UpxY family transcription antiterminator [Terriglobales bacterium]|nr:UpxY family transcription antiterminator [Terriglobales bacterium]
MSATQQYSFPIACPTTRLPEVVSEVGPLRWYAAYTNPRHEKRVQSQMQERLIECFLPLYRSMRRWKDRQKQLDLPLFPGYVLVRIPLQARRSVLTIPGVAQIVSFNGVPAPLRDEEIESLRQGLARNAWMQPHPYLRVGRQVRVCSGPMAGATGILVRRKDKFRLVLSIDLLMRSVAVEIDEGDVEPLL